MEAMHGEHLSRTSTTYILLTTSVYVAELLNQTQILSQGAYQVSSEQGQEISESKREWMSFSTLSEQISKK